MALLLSGAVLMDELGTCVNAGRRRSIGLLVPVVKPYRESPANNNFVSVVCSAVQLYCICILLSDCHNLPVGAQNTELWVESAHEVRRDAFC